MESAVGKSSKSMLPISDEREERRAAMPNVAEGPRACIDAADAPAVSMVRGAADREEASACVSVDVLGGGEDGSSVEGTSC